jgi:hypothetical protein
MNPFFMLYLLICCCLDGIRGYTFYYPDPDNMENRVTLWCNPETYEVKKHGSAPPCSKLVKPLYNTVNWKDEKDILRSMSVRFSYKTFYYGLDAPEGMPLPDRWYEYISPSAGSGECNAVESRCLRPLRCWVQQSMFSYAMNRPHPMKYYDNPKRMLSVDSLDFKDVNRWDTNQTCVMCQPTQCAWDRVSCPNGQVSQLPALGNTKEVYWEPSMCSKSCESGTWLTCPQKSSCTYKVPSLFHANMLTMTKNINRALENAAPAKYLQMVRWQVRFEEDKKNPSTAKYTYDDGEETYGEKYRRFLGENRAQEFFENYPLLGRGIFGYVRTELGPYSTDDLKKKWIFINTWGESISTQESWPLPVGSCYPCALSNGLLHYGKVSYTSPDLIKNNFLKFYCPGGSSAPVYCGEYMVSKIDVTTNRSGVCECMNGYHKVNGVCEICPAGFYCKWEGMTPPTPRECDTDKYSVEGWTDCKDCTKNTAQCTSSEALTRCQRDNGRGTWQKGDARCISCQQCQQVTNAEGSVPCYRVTAAYGADGKELMA